MKSQLLRCLYQLQVEVSLVSVIPEDCNRVHLNKLNEYYVNIIPLSKVILSRHYIRSTQHGLSKGFNFLVNMNIVYENFLTGIIEELIEDDKDFHEYELEKQKRFDSLVREKNIITRPDIILKKKGSKEYPLIIDAKYKSKESSSDYYQVIAYALAIPGAKASCLLYPEVNEPFHNAYTLDRSKYGNDHNVMLYAASVPLLLNEDVNFKGYVSAVKADVKQRLLMCL